MNFTQLNNNGLVDGFGILTKCEKRQAHEAEHILI